MALFSIASTKPLLIAYSILDKESTMLEKVNEEYLLHLPIQSHSENYIIPEADREDDPQNDIHTLSSLPNTTDILMQGEEIHASDSKPQLSGEVPAAEAEWYLLRNPLSK